MAPPPPSATLVAAYAFDEGSGTTVADRSGNGNTGQIGTATWLVTGKYGKALSFNGTSARVTVPSAAALQLTTGMTLEAWVYPTTVNRQWRDVLYKGNDDYFLMATTLASARPVGAGTFGGTLSQVVGTANLDNNTWTHLATTYDGSNLRLYVNGVQVASKAQTGSLAASASPLTIGGDPIDGQFFKGRIDEVRVYRAALSQAEIQADMAAPLGGPPDTTVPSQVLGLAASAVSSGRVDLSWSAASDNVGVTGYEIERCQGAGCSNFAAVTTVSTLGWSDLGRSSGTSYSYRVRARDAAGNTGAYSSVATAVTPAAVDNPPSAPTGLSASASGSSGVNLSWTAATDDLGVATYEVERCQGVGCSGFVQVATTASTSLADTGLVASTSYSYRVRARDTGNQVGPYSSVASATTGVGAATAVGDPRRGLRVRRRVGDDRRRRVGERERWRVAGGVVDDLGEVRVGVVVQRVECPRAGRGFGVVGSDVGGDVGGLGVPGRGAVELAGVSCRRRPTTTTCMEQRRGACGRPPGWRSPGRCRRSLRRALPVGAWSHLAMTYDGSNLRLYVNGVQVATSPQTGPSRHRRARWDRRRQPYGEYFNGRIDEVRVYRTAWPSRTSNPTWRIRHTEPQRAETRHHAPAEGSVVDGGTVNVAYTTTGDLTGVDHVHFQVDTDPVKMDLSLDGTYAYSGVHVGSHTLNGWLVRADHSKIGGTDAIPVALLECHRSGRPDGARPYAHIPANGATVSGAVVPGERRRQRRCLRRPVQAGRASLGSRGSHRSLHTGWNTPGGNGSHVLTAVARDAAGRKTTSAPVSVTVANSGSDPAQVGQWDSPTTLPIVPIHTSMLPTASF